MTSSCPVSSSLSPGVPKFASPCKPYRRRRPNAFNQLRIPCSILDSDWTLFKSDRVVLISRGLLPITHLLDRPIPTHCHPPCLRITTWQLAKAHGVTKSKPKFHVNSHYITEKHVRCYLSTKKIDIDFSFSIFSLFKAQSERIYIYDKFDIPRFVLLVCVRFYLSLIIPFPPYSALI